MGRGLSLLRGAVPITLVLLAPAALVLAAGWRDRRWRRRLLVFAVATAAVVLALAAVLAWGVTLGFTWPKSFYLWLAIPVFAVFVAVGGWRSAPGWRRTTSVVAVVLTAALAGELVNTFYAYYPTVGDLLGAPLPHQFEQQLPATPRHADTAVTADPAVLVERVVASEARADAAELHHDGGVLTVDIPATRSGFHHRRADVYLPPAWFSSPRPQLPVVVFLAGSPGAPDNWIRAGGALRLLAAYAKAHDGVAPVAVFPDHNGWFAGDTECVDGPQGRAETYLVDDVTSYVAHVFGTSTDPAHWGVVGLSEGGTCSLVLGLRHPDRFHTVVDFSGDLTPNLGPMGPQGRTLHDLFGGSREAWAAHDPCTLLSQQRYPALSVWFEAGQTDARRVGYARTLADRATAAGADVHVGHRSGGHRFTFWSKALPDAFPWLIQKLGLPA